MTTSTISSYVSLAMSEGVSEAISDFVNLPVLFDSECAAIVTGLVSIGRGSRH